MAKAGKQSNYEKGKTIPSPAKNKTGLKWNYCLIIFVVPFLLYISSAQYDYNLDDNLVTQNQPLTSQGISAIPEIFKSNYYSDNMGYSYEYRPMVLTSFAIEHQFFGDNPHVSHFINVLLYAFLCFLLYRCLRRFFKNTNYLFSFIIALVFALYPMHTEVVCSIKNRDELLSMIFGLFAFRFAMLFAAGKSYKDLFFVALFFILALLSKKSVLIFGTVIPVFLLLYSGEIYITLITGAIFCICGAVINPGVVIQNGGVYFLAVAFFFGLYLLLGLRDADKRRIFLKPFYDLKNVIIAETDEEVPLFAQTNKPDGAGFWMLSVLNLLLFGLFFYYNIMLLALPAAIAIALFIYSQSRSLQMFNLLAHAVIIAFISYWFIGKPTYLVSLSIMGLLYYYNVHGMRKAIFAAAFLILISYFYKPHTMVQGILLMTLFILQTRYQARWVTICCAIGVGVMSFTKKYFDFSPGEGFTLLSTIVVIVRFGIFTLLLTFTLLPRKAKLQYAPVIILLFSLLLLLRMDGVSPRDPVSGKLPANTVAKIEPRKDFRPLTFSEAPVNLLSPMRTRLGTSSVVALKYLGKTIVPWPLSFYYGYKCIEPADIFSLWAILGITAYALLMLFAFFILRKSQGLFAGILLYVVGIIGVADFFYPLPGMMADRFLFIPSLGFAIALVAGLTLLFKINWADLNLRPTTLPFAPKYLFIAVLITYGGLTFARTADWKDKLTLFRHDINNVEESCQAHNLLATNIVIYSFGIQNPDSQRILRNEALVHFKKAISIYPGYMNTAYDAGRTYELLNQPDSALVYYKIAHNLVDTFAYVNINIGNILMGKRLFAEAVPYFAEANKYDPGNRVPYSQMGLALYSLARYRESLDITEKFIMQFPNIPDGYMNAGRIYEAMNLKDSALICYNRVLIMSNGDPGIKAMIERLEKKP